MTIDLGANFSFWIFAKCALTQTRLIATLQASSLRASGSVPMTDHSKRLRIARMIVAHPAPSRGKRERLRVAANHKQDLETSLSTCTEPWLQGSIATLENQLLGRLPQTKPNPRQIGCADRFPDLSGQPGGSLTTAKERPSMRVDGGRPWRSIA